MKLKTIVSSMAVLGLISTSVFAAAQPKNTANSDNTGWLNQDAYWMSIIDRNQDNAYLVMQKAGDMKFSAYVATDLSYNSKRNGYGVGAGNGSGKTGIDLSVAELYFDAQINPWVSAHIALDYDSDNSNGGFSVGTSDSTAPTINTAYGTTQAYFGEAYAMFNYNNFFAKVGRQYANFGSTAHNTISPTLTQSLSSINETGVTLGAVSQQGFYGDVFIYQGSPYGAASTSATKYDTINSNASMLHGYTVNVGYALNQGQNAFYGNDGGNYYINYIGNMTDVTSIKSTLKTSGSTAWTAPAQQVPGVAVHGDYATGPFQVMADYVTALSGYDSASLTYNGSGAKPAAYSVQATYSWNETNTQSLTLGFDGTQQAKGITPMGSGFTLPENRFLVSYGYVPFKNVKLRLQYENAKDYGTSVTNGTGDINHTVTARVQLVF